MLKFWFFLRVPTDFTATALLGLSYFLNEFCNFWQNRFYIENSEKVLMASN